MSKPFVTFIIPTIGRKTIENTIKSLFYQTNPNWLAIIVIDGVDINLHIDDNRVTIIKIKKTGQHNHAGRVRNAAFDLVNTEWIGFVDDDDCLTNDYVEKLKEEIILNPDTSTVIFRMNNNDLNTKILPPPDVIDFEGCKVGISFSVKKDLTKKYIFEPSHMEDYVLLDKIRSGKNKMVISPYLTYLVNSKQLNYKFPKSYNRAIIN